MAARKGSGITSAEEKIIRATAASKGFNSLEDFSFHLLRQTRSWCGHLYDKFARTYQCERQNSSRRAEHVLFLDKKVNGTCCEIYRNFLVSDCNASFDGKSLQFPDESHLTQKTYGVYEEVREITATMLGLTIKEFEDLRAKKYAEKCKVVSRNLGECVRKFGPNHVDCYLKLDLIEEYCAVNDGRKGRDHLIPAPNSEWIF